MGSSTLVRVKRYVHTIRYLRPRQILWRPYLLLRRRAYAKFGLLRNRFHSAVRQMVKDLEVRTTGPFLVPVEWTRCDLSEHLAVAAAAEQLEFTFLNQNERFEAGIAWDAAHLSQLWKYNLQYQAYLVSLGIAYHVERRPDAYKAFKTIVKDWLANNPMPRGDAWHPYPVSLRVVNWMMAARLFAPAIHADPEFERQLISGLVTQLEYVSRNLEHDVGGNHLLENIKALCVGGVYFIGRHADRWLQAGVSMLQHELERQVLSDGGHYERSPMYHAIVLEDLVLIGSALRNAGISWPVGLQEKLGAMFRFHRDMLHPDRDIALFNDSAFGVAPGARALLTVTARLLGEGTASSKLDGKHALLVPITPEGGGGDVEPAATPLIAFPESGYFAIRGRNSAWFIDAGPVCPDDLPAHAHADILSYELSIHGRRWVVDSGVKEYVAGAWRDYSRSTRAHNTVSINGENQVDVWSSFRVGRRVRPAAINWSSADGTHVITARHSGFGAERTHTRLFVDIDGEAWLVIDEVSGGGPALVENFIHFHPDVDVQPLTDGAVLCQGQHRVRVLTTGFSTVRHLYGQDAPLNGWYMPEFGVAVPSGTAVGVSEGLPSLTAYLLTTRMDVGDLHVQPNEMGRVCSLRIGHEKVEVFWDAQAPKPTTRRTNS